MEPIEEGTFHKMKMLYPQVLLQQYDGVNASLKIFVGSAYLLSWEHLKVKVKDQIKIHHFFADISCTFE